MENSNLPALRPLRFGELFDRGIRLYRHNFLTFVGIMALVYIPYVVIQTTASTVFLALMQNMSSQEMITSLAYWLFMVVSLLGGILNIVLVEGLGTAALTYATARSYLNQKISILDSYRKIGTSWIHLLIALFIFSVIAGMISIWAILPIVGWFTGVGAILFFSAIGELIPAVTVLEKSTWFDPISRAWNLGRRRFWWLLGVSLIFGIFTTLISTGPAMLISAISTSFAGRTEVVLSTLISTILASLLHLITLPVLVVVRTLVYFDLRIRTEGFDLALATLETPANQEIDLTSIPIPPSQQRWLTGEEISKFVIISFIFLGLIALGTGIVAIFLFLVSNLTQR